jgi:hypothetical protein
MATITAIEPGFYRLPLPTALSDSMHGEMRTMSALGCDLNRSMQHSYSETSDGEWQCKEGRGFTTRKPSGR